MSFSGENGTAVLEDSAAPRQESEPATNGKKAKPAANKPLPSERLSVAKHLEVLRAFVVASQDGQKAANNIEVGKIMGMHPNNACVSNTFMASVGLLIKQADGHMPAAEVLNFARAFAYTPENAAHRLAPVFKNVWFGQTVVPLVQLRPRPESEMLAELATACSAPVDAKSQLRMLLEFLEASGLIIRENGMIRMADENHREAEKPAETAVMQQPVVVERPPQMTVSLPEGAIVFNVNIAVSMKEIGSWPKERISAFFDGLAKVISAKAEAT